MAGEWIKMRIDLADDPAVIRIRRATGIDADAVVGKLHRLWSWADAHTTDGFADGLDAEWVDEFVGCQGFAEAMTAAGWLASEEGGIRFANFDRHNGQPAKVRALGKNRMKRIRCAGSATVAQPEEEKRRRREEEYIPAAPVPTSKPATPSGSRAKAAISWSADAGFAGITEADRQAWATAYPGAVLDQELAKATEWLKANPKRCGKRNWRKFLVGWLGRCQERGGTVRETGRRPDEAPKPRAWKDDYRPAPYRRPKEVVALANGLKLKEEDL
jgi:hypothetical protein